MCGRFVSASPPDEIARYFDAVDATGAVVEQNFNVAPTADVYVVREERKDEDEDEEPRRLLDAFHWGLVPRWAKDPSIGSRMINARSEGLADKNAFKWAYRKRRCIVPADGFYEWKRVPGQKVKQPYYFARADGEPLAFAGLWEEWRGPERDGAQRMRTATIITTRANEMMSLMHDRMPVILPPGRWRQWLDRSEERLGELDELLVPAPESLLTCHAVSTDVNNARTTGSYLIEPVEEPSARESNPDPEGASAGVQGTLL